MTPMGNTVPRFPGGADSNDHVYDGGEEEDEEGVDRGGGSVAFGSGGFAAMRKSLSTPAIFSLLSPQLGVGGGGGISQGVPRLAPYQELSQEEEEDSDQESSY